MLSSEEGETGNPEEGEGVTSETGRVAVSSPVFLQRFHRSVVTVFIWTIESTHHTGHKAYHSSQQKTFTGCFYL